MTEAKLKFNYEKGQGYEVELLALEWESDKGLMRSNFGLQALLEQGVNEEGTIIADRLKHVYGFETITLINWDVARKYITESLPKLLPIFEKFTARMEEKFISVK